MGISGVKKEIERGKVEKKQEKKYRKGKCKEK